MENSEQRSAACSTSEETRQRGTQRRPPLQKAQGWGAQEINLGARVDCRCQLSKVRSKPAPSTPTLRAERSGREGAAPEKSRSGGARCPSRPRRLWCTKVDSLTSGISWRN